MIIVHDTFICKPGNASKLVKKFKQAMEGNQELVYLMTDMTGRFNKIVIVTKYESLAAYEKGWETMEQDKEAMKRMEEAMQGYQDMYVEGSREIYRVW
jgi:heme-degrading monooxygenase HmoA